MRALEQSRSQAYQESFVLNILEFKNFGTFLELGAADGMEASNTYLLESHFNWRGLSLEHDPILHKTFQSFRKTTCICQDATNWNALQYLDKLDFPKQIDYLQVDIDPAKQSLDALFNLPLDQYRFSTITFEHDYYVQNDPHVRDASRSLLKSLGYHLFFAGVHTHGRNFEDWWVDTKVPKLKKYEDFYFEEMEASSLFDLT